MKFWLLTHEREIDRETNTGNIVSQVLGESVERIVWQRKDPSATLLHTLSYKSTAFLYPVEDEKSVKCLNGVDEFVLIDATWQESRKIYNHSPYLQQAPKYRISNSKSSKYLLRRNQKESGLCTAECVAELLRLKGEMSMAEELEHTLQCFMDSAGR